MNPNLGISSMDKISKPDGPGGWVSVSNGEIHVQDPGPDGQPAVISAGDSVLVYVNDVCIHGPTDVFSQTHISIQLPFRAFPDYHCHFDVSDDYLSVQLRIDEQETGYLYRIPDSPPLSQLMITTEAVPLPLTAFAEEITRDILAELKQQRIRYGIQPEHIQAAVAQAGTSFVIARGDPAISPQDELEEMFALPEPDPRQPEQFQLAFPALKICKAGELLVRRHLSTESQPGKNIFGELIQPLQNTPKVLNRVDTSVKINPEDNEVRACIEGVPSFNGRDVRVRALDKRLYDLDGGLGSFYDIKGSFQVHGTVESHSQIWGTQHIEVSGDVSHAHLEAHEHIVIHGNIIRSQLMAGGDAAACMRLLSPVQKLNSQMEQMHYLFREIRTSAPRERQPDDQQLFIRIIKTQFPHFMDEVESLWELNQSLKQLHPRRTMLLKVVLSNLLNFKDRLSSEEGFLDWLDKLGKFTDDLKAMAPLKSHIYANYVQGSELFSQGSIFILGEGCYNSQLQAGRDIIFCGSPGYCREGRLVLGGNLIVPELGSPNGSRLEVFLGLHSSIQVKKLYPGVELHFGEKYSKHVLEPGENLEISIKNNELVFSLCSK